MSTNGLNITDDGEMAECEGEKVVTMMDVLQEQQDFEDDANAVLGASDEKNCTFSKGYIKRQAIYACLTCCGEARTDPEKRAGVCLACSLNCHENHELVELYTKRNFCCDCGNPKFNYPCQFTPDKIELNTENLYNQNFSGLYCVCSRPYPDPEATFEFEDEMIQCIVCEDWLHASHLQATVPGNDQYSEMICKNCMEKNDFLHDYSEYVINIEDRDVEVVNGSVVDLPNVNDTEKLVNGGTVYVNDVATDVEINIDEELKENSDVSINENDNEVKNSETNKEIESERCGKTEINDNNIDSTHSAEEIDTIKKHKETEESVISMETKQNEEHKTDICNESLNTERGDIQESETTDIEAKELDENNTDATDTNIKELMPLEKPNIADSEDIVDQIEAKVNEIEENNATTSDKCVYDLQTENKDIKETEIQENLPENDNLAKSTENSEVNFEKCANDLQTENEDIKETDMQEDLLENDNLALITNNDDVNFEKCADDLHPENQDIKDTDMQEDLPENNTLAASTKNDEVTEKCADDLQTENEDIKETDMQEDLLENDNLALSTKNDDVNFEKCADALRTENEDIKETDMPEDLLENDNLDLSTKTDDVNFEKCADALRTENEDIKETDIKKNLPENNLAIITKNDEHKQEPIFTEKEYKDMPNEQNISKDIEGDTLEQATEELSKLASDDSENTKIPNSSPDKNDKQMTEAETNGDSTNHTTSSTNNEDNTHIKLQVTTEHPDNKRKIQDVPEEPVKKPRLDACTRPKSKKVYKGATFWPANFRQKLCTCSECLTMYKDLSVMFLIDPEDTVTAYEALGKERIEGTSISQYEKGLEALSSLDRVQQINALTEYNKMKDKLLDFLKSFKDRKEVVKEEDIRAFFAGMKPRREPDGVYFCR